MTLAPTRVGFIPYLNMVPFHYGFGPGPITTQGRRIEFKTLSPRALGLEAEKGQIDAGALSLVDGLRLSAHFEPLGNLGIGVKREAGSVLLFSKGPLAELRGMCAVTDETSTSVRLLQLLLERRYGQMAVHFGRIASSQLYDDSAQALLLIGDEALLARQTGIPGLPIVTDLGEEWYRWQASPFVFARWMVRRNLPSEVKVSILKHIERSLITTESNIEMRSMEEAQSHHLNKTMIQAYWNSFSFRLTPAHEKAIGVFEALLAKTCLTV
jgi:chorismate dehydratase